MSHAADASHETALPSAAHAPKGGLPRIFVPEGISIPRDYVPLADGTHALYHLELPPAFEGPLDLLLFLIRRHHLDIFDIPVAFICARYLEQLERLQDETMDVASEFLVMAAELMQLKSRMLLPQPERADEKDEGDPRAELVARLLEYQRFRDAAHRLDELPHEGRDTFSRSPSLPPADTEQEALLAVGVMALTKALGAVLARQKPEVRHRVVVEQVPMRRRMLRLIEMLGDTEELPLGEVLREVTERVDLIVMFLAVLELAKLQLLGVLSRAELSAQTKGALGEAEDAAEAGEGAGDSGEDVPSVVDLVLVRRFADKDEALGTLAGVLEEAYAG